MKPYQSHKIVHAAVIQSVEESRTKNIVTFHVNDGSSDLNERFDLGKAIIARGVPAHGDYLVRYENGEGHYYSWSPKDSFEAGNTPIEPEAMIPAGINGDGVARTIPLKAYKDTEARVLETIKEQGFDVTPAALSNTLEELDFDSLDEVELCMAIEKEFSLEIPDSEWDHVTTVQSIVVLVATKLDQIAA